MSKHDKDKDVVFEQVEDESEAGGHDELDALDGTEELLASSAGIGKEIKIGIAVLLVLVMVLGVVVYRRLRRPAAAEMTVATSDDKPEAPTAKTEEPQKESLSPIAMTPRPDRSKMVSAVPGPEFTATKKSSSEADAAWPTSSDKRFKGAMNRDEGRFASSSAPKLAEKDPFNRRLDESPDKLASNAEGWQNDTPSAPRSPAPPAANSFRDQRSTAGPRDATTAPSGFPSSGFSSSGFSSSDSMRPRGSGGAARPLDSSRQTADTRNLAGGLSPSQSGGQDPFSVARLNDRGTGADSPAKPLLQPVDQASNDRYAPHYRKDESLRGTVPPVPKPSNMEPAPAFNLGNTLQSPDPRPFDRAGTAPTRPLGASPTAYGDLAARNNSEPPRRADSTYVVQPNDNYAKISKRLYGNEAYYQALAQYNIKKYPNVHDLQPNDVILTPTVAELEKLYPGSCPSATHREAMASRSRSPNAPSHVGDGQVYVVQEGDTLFDIANSELGKASRWPEIYERNKETLGKQFDYLTPGMRLVMPNGTGSTASQHGESGLVR